MIHQLCCPMTEAKWIKSHLNRGTWVITLLNRNNCVMTMSYRFWPSDKHSIQHLVLEPRSQV